MIANKGFAKIGFYLLSMAFFLIIVMILSTDISVYFGKDAKFVGWSNFCKMGIIIPIVCALLLLFAGGFACWLRHKSKAEAERFIKLFDDDILRSELTQEDYDSFVKKD